MVGTMMGYYPRVGGGGGDKAHKSPPTDRRHRREYDDDGNDDDGGREDEWPSPSSVAAWPTTTTAATGAPPRALSPASPEEGGGCAVEEDYAKTTVIGGGGGGGGWTQKLGRDGGGDDDDDGEYDADDVSWSIRSNACFVAGGLIHLWGASWDYAMYHHRDVSAATPDDSVVSPLDQYACYNVAYQSIWILGPSVYLLNSIIDVRNVLRVARRTREDRSRDDDGRQREREHDDDRGYDDVDGTTFARSGSPSKEWRRRRRRRRPEFIGAGLLPVSSRAHRRKIFRGGTIGLLRPRRAVAALEGAVAAIGRRCRRFARRASAAALGPPPRPGSAGGGRPTRPRRIRPPQGAGRGRGLRNRGVAERRRRPV